MKKALLAGYFIFISLICSAPNIDFRLEMLKVRSFSESVKKKYYESELSRFISDLGYRESGNNWLSVNQIGCFGEWQFDESTLKYLGFRTITLEKFIADPQIFPRELQLKALRTLMRVNRIHLMNYEHFIGDSINGVVITKSGMIAAAHLGGAGSMQKFLRSNGSINSKDVLGTSILDYLKKFRHYDLE